MGYIAKIIFKIHTLAKGLFFGLMVTTAWMAYRVCESALGGSIMLSPVWESVLVVGATLVITYLIDNALYENSVAALAQAIEQGGFWKVYKKGGFATLILFALMAGRFFFSGGATYLTGESTVAERQAEPEHNHTGELLGLQDQKNKALQELRKSKQEQANKVLERAEKLAQKKVDVAIKQGSPVEQKAYQNGQWVRAAYSVAIKKAEREAYKIQEQAEREYNQIIKDMRTEAKRIADDPAWAAAQSSIQSKASAAAMLYTAERWTYYLLDFILVVGGFFCSWLVAFHIVHSDDTMETFFPDKPGITDVFGDMLGSIYTYFVTMIAQVPAYFKEEGSKRMVRVAKSVGKSSSAYNAAIAEYLVASHPTVNAQVGLVAHQTAMQKAQQRAQQAQQRAQQENEAAQIRMRQEAQQARQQYSSAASTMSSVNTSEPSTYPASPEKDDSATGATEGATSATNSETGETQPKRKQSGAAFRSYLSRAGQAFAAGDDDTALKLLDVARQVLPDDGNKAKRLEKLNELKKAIENG